MKELKLIILKSNKELSMKELMLYQVDSMSSSYIKDLLFEYYTMIGDMISYNRINKWSKQYLQKINKGISEEAYIIYEHQLILKE